MSMPRWDVPVRYEIDKVITLADDKDRVLYLTPMTALYRVGRSFIGDRRESEDVVAEVDYGYSVQSNRATLAASQGSVMGFIPSVTGLSAEEVMNLPVPEIGLPGLVGSYKTQVSGNLRSLWFSALPKLTQDEIYYGGKIFDLFWSSYDRYRNLVDADHLAACLTCKVGSVVPTYPGFGVPKGLKFECDRCGASIRQQVDSLVSEFSLYVDDQNAYNLWLVHPSVRLERILTWTESQTNPAYALRMIRDIISSEKA